MCQSGAILYLENTPIPIPIINVLPVKKISIILDYVKRNIVVGDIVYTHMMNAKRSDICGEPLVQP